MPHLDLNVAAMKERNDNSSVQRPLLAKVAATTIVAWVVAFLVVTALLSLFGDQLGASRSRCAR
jgi:hypothetical protein